MMTVEEWLQAIERRDEKIRDLEWQVETLRGLLRAKRVGEQLAPAFRCNPDESAGLAEVHELHSVKA